MGLIATIHTTDIDQMAELVAAAKHHGPVELRYVDGGLELHRPDTTGPDAVIVPLNATPEPAPQPARTPSRRKTTPKKKPTPTPATKPSADTTCPDCVHVAASPNGLAIHRGRRHRPIDHDAIRQRAADGI